MDVTLYIKDFMDDTGRPMHQQIEEAADIARRAESLGFMGIFTPQHWVGYPTVWLEPLPLLARLAPEAKELGIL